MKIHFDLHCVVGWICASLTLDGSKKQKVIEYMYTYTTITTHDLIYITTSHTLYTTPLRMGCGRGLKLPSSTCFVFRASLHYPTCFGANLYPTCLWEQSPISNHCFESPLPTNQNVHDIKNYLIKCDQLYKCC